MLIYAVIFTKQFLCTQSKELEKVTGYKEVELVPCAKELIRIHAKQHEVLSEEKMFGHDIYKTHKMRATIKNRELKPKQEYFSYLEQIVCPVGGARCATHK